MRNLLDFIFILLYNRHTTFKAHLTPVQIQEQKS